MASATLTGVTSEDIGGGGVVPARQYPELDALRDACEGGSGAACDELWARAPIDSVYEQFGVTCGNRFEVLDCTREMDEPAEATDD